MESSSRCPELFYFEPLRFAEAVTCFAKRKAELRTNEPQVIFDQWIRRYCKRACQFYNSQLTSYQVTVEKEFRRAYGLRDSDSLSELDLDSEWEDWIANTHFERSIEITEIKTQALVQLAASLGTNDQSQNESGFASLREIFLRPINLLGRGMVSRMYHDLDEQWFNQTIQSTIQNNQRLRALSYEQYLRRSHWRKVRAAMLLINRAVCQAPQCAGVGESCYGATNESGLHVHHLSYSNLGCERFSDLKLLCNKHHERMHENVA